MKVYACYLRVQKVEHWEIVSDDIQFITSSFQDARDWVNKFEAYSEDNHSYYTHYYKEFELQ